MTKQVSACDGTVAVIGINTYSLYTLTVLVYVCVVSSVEILGPLPYGSRQLCGGNFSWIL